MQNASNGHEIYETHKGTAVRYTEQIFTSGSCSEFIKTERREMITTVRPHKNKDTTKGITIKKF
jgi:hypothetical protein